MRDFRGSQASKHFLWKLWNPEMLRKIGCFRIFLFTSGGTIYYDALGNAYLLHFGRLEREE